MVKVGLAGMENYRIQQVSSVIAFGKVTTKLSMTGALMDGQPTGRGRTVEAVVDGALQKITFGHLHNPVVLLSLVKTNLGSVESAHEATTAGRTEVDTRLMMLKKVSLQVSLAGENLPRT